MTLDNVLNQHGEPSRNTTQLDENDKDIFFLTNEQIKANQSSKTQNTQSN